MENKPPRRLYKYRKFDLRTFSTLGNDQLWFANLKSFNEAARYPTLTLEVDNSTVPHCSASCPRSSNDELALR